VAGCGLWVANEKQKLEKGKEQNKTNRKYTKKIKGALNI